MRSIMVGVYKIVPIETMRRNTPYEDRSDDDLMRLAKEGRVRAFETLVRRHQGSAFEIAHSYLRQAHVAHDAVQDAFVALYHQVPRYEPQGRFRAFLYRVVLNQCRMVVRSRKTREKILAEFETFPVNRADLPDEWLFAREQKVLVDRAVAEMGDKLKQVLVLRLAAGLSYAKISETLNIPMGTVKSRLAAATDRIRAAIEVDSK